MKILLLSPDPDRIKNFLLENGDEVIDKAADFVFDLDFLKSNDIEFIISYRYTKIIKADIIKAFQDKLINLHPSLLPYNRGRHPNLWSFIDNTPKGVTIHYIDEGVDTGDIIAQKELVFEDNETLSSSYWKGLQALEDLLITQWHDIKSGNITRIKQEGEGTFHLGKDLDSVSYLLDNGWDTLVSKLKSP